MSLQIRSEWDKANDLWQIGLEGELDIAVAQELKSTLEKAYEQTRGNIAIEAEHLSFIDSIGLGVIIGMVGKMKEDGHTIKIRHPRNNIEKLLRITQLDKVLLEE